MTDQRRDDLLSEIENALLIEPSPEFEAKVRERIAADRHSSGWLLKWGTAVGAVAAALAVIVLIWRTSPVVQPNVTSPAPVIARGPELQSTAVAAVAPAVPRRTATRASRRSAPRILENAAAVREEFEVLVPPDQAIALRSLLQAIREGRAAVPPDTATGTDDDGWLLAPAPIQLTPITIVPIAPAPDGGGWRK